jgi:hypothetical protein
VIGGRWIVLDENGTCTRVSPHTRLIGVGNSHDSRAPHPVCFDAGIQKVTIFALSAAVFNEITQKVALATLASRVLGKATFIPHPNHDRS